MNLSDKIDSLMMRVTKPVRYVGGEFGSIMKDPSSVDVRYAFLFPDTYEVGMSHLGMKILYHTINKREDAWCERVFSPWVDMEELMRQENIPLFSLESRTPVKEFDLVGVTLQYEMSYTNILSALDLAGIPLRQADRKDGPFIICGGPCAFNPEPLTPFVDLFVLGDGEKSTHDTIDVYKKWKASGLPREEYLRMAAQIPGVYVPSLYRVTYNEDSTVQAYTPLFDDIPKQVRKRIISDMDQAYFPDKVVMPYIETVQDRIMLEVYRGCIRGCRFCQAGMVYRPVREKTPEVLDHQAKCLFEATGYEEMSLSSLSISDYTQLDELTDRLLSWTDENMISLNLPSLRVDSFTRALMDKISTVRTSSLTFAPEAGTQRLRDVINKNVYEDDLMRAVGVAFEAGKNQVKLYFMDGLPTETDEDLEGISTLAKHVLDQYYATPDRPKRAPGVTVSVSCFIPKPFTPFQWEAQASLEELERKQAYLRSVITDRKVKLLHHDAKTCRIEAVLARGDRRLGAALALACREGFVFDAWDEFFDYDKWISVLQRTGIDPAFYANRVWGEDEVLPWDIIDCGVTKDFFKRERARAYSAQTTPNCREHCSGCGANQLGGERSCCPKKN